MNQIAIGIVLLPDKTTTELAISLSSKLDSDLLLTSEYSVPHITLSMGFIQKKNLQNACNIVDAISRIFPPLGLSATEFSIQEIKENLNLCALKITESEDLLILHSQIARELAGLEEKNNANAEAFSSSFPADELTIDWTMNYTENLKESGFNPHITLGFGTPPTQIFPIDFAATQIALYQLGKYCSCQELILREQLKGGEE